MRYATLLLLLTLALSSCSQPSNESADDKLHKELLALAAQHDKPRVSFRRTGYSGSYSEEYERIWELSQLSGAVDTYLEQAKSSNPAEQLYALMGLKIMKSKHYTELLQQLLTSKAEVLFGPSGCVFYTQTVGEVAKEINEAELCDPN